MIAIIREADREPVSGVAKRHGISEQPIYTWRKRFGCFREQTHRIGQYPTSPSLKPGKPTSRLVNW